MVDITGVENDDVDLLKMEIIDTLCGLPITNKNVIEDSKVLSVVQRWAKPEQEEKSTADESTEIANQPKQHCEMAEEDGKCAYSWQLLIRFQLYWYCMSKKLLLQ